MAVAGDKSTLFANNQADTLRLVLYLTLAVALMVTDHHSGYLREARAALSTLAVPLYRIAQAPVAGARWLHAAGSERVELKRENDSLRAELLLAQARLNAARIESDQNRRLHELLDAGRRYRLSGRMVQVFDIDIGPFRQRLVLDAGNGSGIQVGQPVIDAHGLVGQVIATAATSSTVMLLTDTEHAVPVSNSRTGQRAVLYGQGRDDQVLLPTLPISSDIRPGDLLITSGLGGRFPTGFPVALVTRVGSDANGTFAQAWAEPLAQLRRSTELLLLEETPIDDAAAIAAAESDVDGDGNADGTGPATATGASAVDETAGESDPDADPSGDPDAAAARPEAQGTGVDAAAAGERTGADDREVRR